MKLKIDKKILRRLLMLFFLFIVFVFLYAVRNILFPFVLAIVLAYILNPLVEKLEKHNIKRLYGITIVYIVVFGVLFLACFYGFPVILKQLTAFVEKIPLYTNEIQNRLQNFYHLYQRFTIPYSLRESIDHNILWFQNLLITSLSNLVSSIFSLFSEIFSFIVAPILTFYLLKDKEEICRLIVQNLPLNKRSEILSIWSEIDLALLKFIQGNLLVALIVGIATSIGLTIVGMDFPLLFGIISGITNIIPYFGPIIGAIPAVSLALLKSQSLALYVILVMLIVQQLESNFISPKILGNSIGVHPLLVIFVLLAGGQLWGIAGMLVAVPLTAILKIIIRYLFLKLIV
ncbi:AI-2E family transporter [Bacillota bacterium LX-D]|nr:AI-2E family transporter [Bacillota bacterium LX-D]